MPNHLADETSPYLLQHATNPVDWYPWGPEALERARDEDKPIFLSIGYAACHWCHVMAHESFEDEATAAFLNEQFVAIKVDREERPDLDTIYMDAVVALTGNGGWPMSVFMTPEGVPIFAGTYFPDVSRQGMPSFRQVLEAIATAWKDEREKIRGGAEQLKAALRRAGEAPEHATLEAELLARAKDYLGRAFDRRNGGFGGAPKFPQPMALDFLLRSAVGAAHDEEADGGQVGDEESLRIVTRTLDKMARGGIYDQLGGGFHRYAVDEIWLVPHFEKMLYDNAQLAIVYLHAWQLTGRELYRRVVTETLDYVLREMAHDTAASGGGTGRGGTGGGETSGGEASGSAASGGAASGGETSAGGTGDFADGRESGARIAFYSTQDADSLDPAGEMEEGAFYTWTPAEVKAALGPDDEGAAPGSSALDAASDGSLARDLAGPPGRSAFSLADVNLFLDAYGVNQRGNFEGRTILSSVLDPDVLGERHGLAQDDVERRLAAMRQRLVEARQERTPPGRDDKVLTAWNGLMLAAFAEAARVLGREDYRRAAEANAAFLLENLRDERGRVLRSWKGGVAKLNGYLEDYADLAAGLLQLYQTSFDEHWFVAARELADQILEHFADGGGGFYATSDDHEELLRRPRSQEDNALPSGGAMATLVLVQLAAYTGAGRYADAAELALRLIGENAATMPLGFAQWLVALDLYLAPPLEVAIVGEGAAGHEATPRPPSDEGGRRSEPAEALAAFDPLLAVVRSAFRPHALVAASPDPEKTQVPLLMGRRIVDGRPAAYVCRHFACDVPVTEPAELARALA